MHTVTFLQLHAVQFNGSCNMNVALLYGRGKPSQASELTRLTRAVLTAAVQTERRTLRVNCRRRRRRRLCS